MMPPNAQEVLKTFLSVMATTEDVAWLFYVVALFQISVAACHLNKNFRNKRILTILMTISALLLPVLLIVGFYYAMRPVA